MKAVPVKQKLSKEEAKEKKSSLWWKKGFTKKYTQWTMSDHLQTSAAMGFIKSMLVAFNVAFWVSSSHKSLLPHSYHDIQFHIYIHSRSFSFTEPMMNHFLLYISSKVFHTQAQETVDCVTSIQQFYFYSIDWILGHKQRNLHKYQRNNLPSLYKSLGIVCISVFVCWNLIERL